MGLRDCPSGIRRTTSPPGDYPEFHSKEEASPEWKQYEVSFVPEQSDYCVLGLYAAYIDSCSLRSFFLRANSLAIRIVQPPKMAVQVLKIPLFRKYPGEICPDQMELRQTFSELFFFVMFLKLISIKFICICYTVPLY